MSKKEMREVERVFQQADAYLENQGDHHPVEFVVCFFDRKNHEYKFLFEKKELNSSLSDYQFYCLGLNCARNFHGAASFVLEAN